MADQRYPVGYVRRSYADAGNPGDVSREVQEGAIREMAHRDGHNGDVVMFVDWGKSASESSTRTRYAALLKAVEDGHVSTIYAYALDRLNRSLVMSARFAKACEAGDVRIVTHREGEVRQDSPGEWLRWTILATFGEYELRTITARNTAAIAARRADGGWIGRVGYGWKLERNEEGVVVRVNDPAQPVDHILDAVRDARTILGAAKLLKARGYRSPDELADWGNTTLRRIVEQHAPELLPTVGPTGRRQASRTSILAQLLVCHCGHVLTPEPGRASYRCRIGTRRGSADHGLANVPERSILPWIKTEAARFDPLRVGTHAVEGDPDNDRRALLVESRRRLALAYSGGALDDATYQGEDQTIMDTLATLDAGSATKVIPPAIRWEATAEGPAFPAAAINSVLRTYWSSVVLGPDLRPVKAEWKLPMEWIS